MWMYAWHADQISVPKGYMNAVLYFWFNCSFVENNRCVYISTTVMRNLLCLYKTSIRLFVCSSNNQMLPLKTFFGRRSAFQATIKTRRVGQPTQIEYVALFYSRFRCATRLQWMQSNGCRYKRINYTTWTFFTRLVTQCPLFLSFLPFTHLFSFHFEAFKMKRNYQMLWTHMNILHADSTNSMEICVQLCSWYPLPCPVAMWDSLWKICSNLRCGKEYLYEKYTLQLFPSFFFPSFIYLFIFWFNGCWAYSTIPRASQNNYIATRKELAF